jgi:hypothetical protein
MFLIYMMFKGLRLYFVKMELLSFSVYLDGVVTVVDSKYGLEQVII